MTIKTSSITPTDPVASSKLQSAPVRNNFFAAYTDINSIFSILGVQQGGTTVALSGGTVDNAAIGSITPSTGAFTTVLATTFTGNLVGNASGSAATVTAASQPAIVTCSNLTTVGTIGSGTWQGSLIAGQYGGTGVANTGKTITLGGNIATVGAFNLTLTLSALTSVTLPTSGTLVGSADTGTVSTNMIAANAVTYAKFQQVAASSLVGNATGGLANATGVTLGAALTFSGSALQTAAMTGDVTTAANSFSTSVAKINGVTVSGTTGTGKVVFDTAPTVSSITVSSAAGTTTSLVQSQGANNAYQVLDCSTAAQYVYLDLRDAGVSKWQVFKDFLNAFYIRDPVGAKNFISATTGGNLVLPMSPLKPLWGQSIQN